MEYSDLKQNKYCTEEMSLIIDQADLNMRPQDDIEYMMARNDSFSLLEKIFVQIEIEHGGLNVTDFVKDIHKANMDTLETMAANYRSLEEK